MTEISAKGFIQIDPHLYLKNAESFNECFLNMPQRADRDFKACLTDETGKYRFELFRYGTNNLLKALSIILKPANAKYASTYNSVMNLLASKNKSIQIDATAYTVDEDDNAFTDNLRISAHAQNHALIKEVLTSTTLHYTDYDLITNGLADGINVRNDQDDFNDLMLDVYSLLTENSNFDGESYDRVVKKSKKIILDASCLNGGITYHRLGGDMQGIADFIDDFLLEYFK